MPERVLVIDDDPAHVRMIELALLDARFQPVTATSGEEGLRKLLAYRPDLVILDVIMPGMDGLETCARIRQVSTVPVIFLTAKQSIDDKVAGLQLGGDDYLVKPFSPGELIARVEAVLRRSHRPLAERDAVLRVGGRLVIDRGTRQVVVRNQSVSLRPAEYNLLLILAERAGQVVSAEQIGELMGITDPGARPRRVKWHIWKLRQSIESDPHKPELVLTRRGGYLLANS
ncbi:MAG TPA: response regulator transcription factor [Anaerolineae bacterium]|nr:response regulator transcription factor [Anaerolineae bacterium]